MAEGPFGHLWANDDFFKLKCNYFFQHVLKHAIFEISEISADISCIGECRHDISFRLSVIGNFGFLSVFYRFFPEISVTVHESVLFTTVYKMENLLLRGFEPCPKVQSSNFLSIRLRMPL